MGNELSLESKGSNFESVLSPYSKIIIGDENSSSFKPHVRIDKWNGECSFGFGLPNLGSGIQPTFDGSEIKLTDGNTLVKFYPLANDKWNNDKGGFEFEIIYSSPPMSPILTLPVETNGLKFLYQGALNSWEIKRGNTRPDNVVGSLAVYHDVKGGMHYVPGDADKYQAGKAFHIFRPEAIDALGNRIWLDMLFDQETSELKIILEPTWFANATYPVIVDPTIGNNNLGASLDNTDEYSLMRAISASASGDANPGTAYYGGSADSGTKNVYVCAYTGGGADPGSKTRLALTAVIALTTTLGFFSSAITWTGITNGTSYWLGGWSNNAGTNTAYDSGGGTGVYNFTVAASPPDPYALNADHGVWNNQVSIYVDYTASSSFLASPGKFNRQAINRSFRY